MINCVIINAKGDGIRFEFTLRVTESDIEDYPLGSELIFKVEKQAVPVIEFGRKPQIWHFVSDKVSINVNMPGQLVPPPVPADTDYIGLKATLNFIEK